MKKFYKVSYNSYQLLVRIFYKINRGYYYTAFFQNFFNYQEYYGKMLIYS